MPLSYTQQRIWFLQQLFPGNRAYNMSEAWRIHGPLDVNVLQQALQRIVHRHSSLRTRFVAPDNEPMQQVTDEIDLPLTVTNISHLSPADREEALLKVVLAEGNHAFDLNRGPLIRPSLIHLDSDDHVLQLVLHHIVTDEWSNDIIWRELAFYYTNALESGDNDLPESLVQYSDFARWQRDQVAAGTLDQQMWYWQDQLSGDLPLVQLPSERSRPSERSLRGGIVRRVLPAELLQGMQALSQQAGTTLYTALLAAFQMLLYRYSGQEDILVGTPIANRQRAETKNVIGMFVNTAVMRASVSGDMTFRQLVAQVRQTVLDALANQDLPFDMLVQVMQPDRDLSYNPLFQTMFVFRSDGVERMLPGVSFEPVKVDRGVSKFDLTMFAGEEDGCLMTALEYNADLFDEATAIRMLDHWQTLLGSSVAAPDAPIQSLPLLNTGERKLILNTWNNTTVSLSETRCLHELISAQAVRTPKATAVIAGKDRLTYRELEDRANQLAHYLIRRGVVPGTPVGLFTERSLEMVVGILGILKASAAYVPLAPEYPAERIAFALEDTYTPFVITQTHLAERLAPSKADVIILDSQQLASESGWPNGPPQTAITLNHLAYIIYTSGSTGTPKGVMVTHRNLLASTLARKIYYEEPVERFLLLSSFAFDSSVAGIFWTLAVGGALVLPAPDEEKEVHKLEEIIAREKITHTLVLPTLYRLLLTYASEGNLDSLKVVIVAGEACPPDLGQMHYQILPYSMLFNEYGPTEATVWCSVYQLPRSSDGGSVPIGRPIANSKLFVLDQIRQPVPIGVPGELFVIGKNVTPGYWNKPELTAENFSTLALDGYSDTGPAYRTGDLARWRADGQIEFLGRVDNQVKIRGYRIEPGEIESRLMHHPSVQEAVVTIREQSENGAESDKSLVAYVMAEVTGKDEATYCQKLQSYLAKSLPDYMVPNQIIVVSAFPRTPSGKVDRKRLPASSQSSKRRRPFVPPRTETEEILARLWSDILHIDEVSVDDKFFELGGDSLMSIRVIAGARQEGLILTPRQLFKEQTIARLADVAGIADESAATPMDVTGPVPLTPIQHWFFSQRLSDPTHWNQAAWFEAAERLDLDTLNAALAHLIKHHSMLRARYRMSAAGWQQEVVGEPQTVFVESISLAGHDPAAQDAALLAAANKLHAGMNLAEGPLLQGLIFDLGSNRLQRLLLIIHHLVVDAVSWRIIGSDLAAAYQQIASRKTVSLPPALSNYAQWAQSLSNIARSNAMQREVDYWRNAVTIQNSLPRDFISAGDNTEGEAKLVTLSLSSELTNLLLVDVHHAYHTRIEDLLLAALARSVVRWSGSSTMLITLERHGREEIESQLDVSQTVGWFTSLFPVTLALDDLEDMATNLRTVKEQLRGIPQNGIGYGILRYLGDKESRRQLTVLQQPEILFNYLGQIRDQNEGGALLRRVISPIGRAYGSRNSRAHLIDINTWVYGGRLVLNWQYAENYFRKATIERLAESYIEELTALIHHCIEVERSQHTPSDFPLSNLQQDDLDSLADLLAGLE